MREQQKELSARCKADGYANAVLHSQQHRRLHRRLGQLPELALPVQRAEWDGGRDPEFIAQVGAMAMGSTTYEWIADYTGFLTDPSKWEYTVPTWVLSSRELPRVEGPDIRFVSGDVVKVHQEMVRTAEGKNVWLVGGGDLVGQFHDQGLLDEVIIGMASVTLAQCPALPRRIVTPPLQLLDATAYGADFVTPRYAVRKPSET